MMNTLDAKWLFYNSPPSTPCYHFSESEHTEDEADVSDEGITIGFLSHPQNTFVECKKGTSQLCLASALPDVITIEAPSSTPGDMFFAKKCAALHSFVHPLHQLLHKLKTGRYNKGLTTSQQNVAIDRLQKILGMLQRPEMGRERHLHNLLQIEIMLKMWFPHVTPFQSTRVKSQTPTPRITPHWQQNQLHMPVKKRKLNWVDPDNSNSDPDSQKSLQYKSQSRCQVLDTTCLPRAIKTHKRPENKDDHCESHLWTEQKKGLKRPYQESSDETSPCSFGSSQCTPESSISSSSVLPQLSSNELVINWMSSMPVRVKTEWFS